ncbi:MAG: tRNA (guanosine(37)-N1)-methyltransferase TrmD, partial [Oscillospiraceae bacterium]|nr:tRNA (guanosine(37)-N1)-methyltransferase TrmD [Oscillospiraceae bacterium]
MTLFPDTVSAVLGESIIGKAQANGIVKINCHQIRDYTTNKQKQVDDYPYGGGMGMVMQIQPLYDCWKHICDEADERLHTIYMSPQGKVFKQ